MVERWQSGQRESDGRSIFFADRNTAVRCAEVHSLPLNFPLKKAGYGLQAHGNFGMELFYLLLWISERIF